MLEKGSADWLKELPSVIKKYYKTIHSSTKLSATEASKKSNEKLVFSNVSDVREKQHPKFKLGQLVRTADIKKVFSKGDSTNWSYRLYTVTEFLYDTVPSYRINYLSERCNQNLLLPTNYFLMKTIKL